MPQSSFALMTALGRAKEAAALANATTIDITHIAIGNGVTVPSGGETQLYNEVDRKTVSARGVVGGSANTMFADIFLAADDGPYVISEAGLIDSDGDLIAIARYDPPINKPIPSSGQTIEGVIRLQVAFSNASVVNIVVDSAMLVALQRLSRIPWVPINAFQVNTPPSTPAAGDTYVIGSAPTGAWAGNAGKLAEYTTVGWSILTPPNGHGVGAADGRLYVRIGDAYVEYTASETRRGLIELATAAEVQAGADAERAVTPAGLAALTSTELRRGIVELATNAEVQAGIDTQRAVTPAGLKSAVGAAIQAHDGDLDALAAISGTGFAVRLGAGSWATRSLLGTAGEITVNNGTGVAGNVSFSLASALTFTGKTITGGTFNGPVIGAHSFSQPVTVKAGTFASQSYMIDWGWATGYRVWSWILDSDGTIRLWTFNGSNGSSIGEVLNFNQTNRAAIFVGNIGTNGGITAALQSTFQSNVNILGSLAKASGTFWIDHPLDPENKDLVHGFVETPEHQVRYRGTARLTAGRATVNIDAAAGMTAGTFEALTKNAEVMTVRNKSGFAQCIASDVIGGVFTVTCQDEASADTIVWEVAATRNDPYVRSGLDPSTDENGDLIVEPEKKEAA